MQRRGASPVVTYNLISRNQTLEQDVALVKALPKIPMLIFIRAKRGRFTSPPTTTASTTPVATKGAYAQLQATTTARPGRRWPPSSTLRPSSGRLVSPPRTPTDSRCTSS